MKILFCFLMTVSIIKLGGQSDPYPNYLNHGAKSFDLIPVQKGKLFGYVNRSNQEVIPPDYEKASWFDDRGIAQVMKFGLNGLIDKSGKELVPCMSRSQIGSEPCQWMTNEDKYTTLSHLLFIKNDVAGKVVLFNRIKLKSSIIYYLKEGPLAGQTGYYSSGMSPRFINGYMKVVKENGKINFIDTTFQEVFKTDIYDGKSLGKGIFAVYDETKKAALVTPDGKSLTVPFIEKIENTFNPDLFIVKLNDPKKYSSKFGVINSKGVLVIDTLFESVKSLENGYFEVRKESKSGLFNSAGKQIIPFEYSELSALWKNTFTVGKDQKFYVINEMNQIQSALSPVRIQKYLEKDFAFTQVKDTFTLYDLTGKKLFTVAGIDYIKDKIGDHFLFTKRNLWGIVHPSGTYVLNPEYSTLIRTNVDDCLIASSGNSYGLYHLKKGWIHPITTDSYIHVNNSSDKAEKDIVIVRLKKETITYEKSLLNKKSEPVKEQTDRYDYGIKQTYEGNNTKVMLQDGRTFTFPKEPRQEYLVSGNKLMIIRRNQQKMEVLNENLVSIVPESLVCLERRTMKGRTYFVLMDANKQIGLADHDMKFIFLPAPGQSFREVDDVAWIRNESGSLSIYDTQFKPFTSIKYKYIDILDQRMFICKTFESRYLDVWSKKGKLLSSGKFLTVTKNKDISYTVTQNDTLASCSTDTLLQIKKCLPFAEILALKDSPTLFIAKDLYDYGLVDGSGKEIIPFTYKKIEWLENVNLLQLTKGNYYCDIADIKGNILIRNYKGHINFNKITDHVFYCSSHEEHLFYNMQEKKVSKISHAGYIRQDAELLNKGKLVCISDNGNLIYFDLNTGTKYGDTK